MAIKNAEILVPVAEALGLNVDEEENVIFGQNDGLTLYINKNSSANIYQIHFCLKKEDGVETSKDILKNASKTIKHLMGPTINEPVIMYSVKAGMTKEKTKDRLITVSQELIAYLKEHHFQNVCEKIGLTGHTDVCQVKGGLHFLSPKGFEDFSFEANTENQLYDGQKENVGAGIIGALLGSLVGSLAVLLVGQMGYVSVWTGIAMGVCTLKGYELLAKKLSRKGVVFSVVIILVMTFIANQFDWALTIARQANVNVFDAFQAMGTLMSEGYIDMGVYYGNLALLYLFSAGGALLMIWEMVARNKKRYVSRKL
ncbi:FUSC family protein [Streptococcus massiliensis]|uniref:Uncharacterized protein n=1 Tax=Streptococcus massiliensis TaxID=313439 RepID=A0A380KXK7_9STRE|nr:FUSC family protein [Streptococcus massiliensis]SUN76019.1 Uncharacterised protein [Streptococcus massiliensis]